MWNEKIAHFYLFQRTLLLVKQKFFGELQDKTKADQLGCCHAKYKDYLLCTCFAFCISKRLPSMDICVVLHALVISVSWGLAANRVPLQDPRCATHRSSTNQAKYEFLFHHFAFSSIKHWKIGCNLELYTLLQAFWRLQSGHNFRKKELLARTVTKIVKNEHQFNVFKERKDL